MFRILPYLLTCCATVYAIAHSPAGMAPNCASHIVTMMVEGTLSASGNRSVPGASFQAELDSAGNYLVTMNGPFGITMARMYATADSFVLVNYLEQQVWYGNPNNPDLLSAAHLPVSAAEFMILLKGGVPGNAQRFSPANRPGEHVLFVSRDSLVTEYLLVDTTRNVVLQYQRKDTTSQILLDVVFTNIKMTDSVALAHHIDIDGVRRQQSVSITLTNVRINQPMPKPLSISIPQAYQRRYFH